MSYMLMRATEAAKKHGFDVKILYKADREYARNWRTHKIGEKLVVTVEGCPVKFERNSDRRGNTLWLEQQP